MVLNVQFISKIRQILVDYHRELHCPELLDERDFIKRTATFFRNRRISHGQESLTSRSTNIDKSPLVRFHHTTPWPNPDIREIGDLLFVSKFKTGNRIVKRTGVIVQSKFTGKRQRSWKGIDTAQLYLIFRWPDFTRVSPTPQKAYSLSPSCLTWGTYAFLGSDAVNYPVYYTSSRILREYPHTLSQKTFTFNLKKLVGWDTSPCFLMKQILCFIGEDLLTNSPIELFVDDLYKIVGLKPDPAGEFEWESTVTEESKGFGIVEFTVSTPEIE